MMQGRGQEPSALDPTSALPGTIRMLSYVLKRILATLPVMGVVVVFVFLLVRIAPGDPAAIIAGDYATPETIQKMCVGLGLDTPIHVQFGIHVTNLIRGDLGRSLLYAVRPAHPALRGAARSEGAQAMHEELAALPVVRLVR